MGQLGVGSFAYYVLFELATELECIIPSSNNISEGAGWSVLKRYLNEAYEGVANVSSKRLWKLGTSFPPSDDRLV